MLWDTLYNKIGKQSLSFSRRNHVKAIIDGKTIELELKYDSKGHPYLAECHAPAKKPYRRVMYYWVCRETPEILGSGSSYSMEECVYSEEEAFVLLADGRNCLERRVVDLNGKVASHWWNPYKKKWFDGQRELPM